MKGEGGEFVTYIVLQPSFIFVFFVWEGGREFYQIYILLAACVFVFVNVSF